MRHQMFNRNSVPSSAVCWVQRWELCGQRVGKKQVWIRRQVFAIYFWNLVFGWLHVSLVFGWLHFSKMLTTWTLETRYASILKEVVYPVVERNECQVSHCLVQIFDVGHICYMKILNTSICDKKKLRTTRLGRFFELDKSFICAGGIQASQKW